MENRQAPRPPHDFRQQKELERLIQEQGRLRAALEALERELEYFASQVQKEHDIPSHSPPPVEVPADLPEEAQPAFEPEPSAPPPLPAPSPAPSAEPATANEEPREPESLELELGTVWLARIGIVILVTGFVFLGNYAWQHIVPHLGPGGKVGLLYAAAALLGGAGLALERRRMGTDAGRYGQVLMAGGAATAYYTTYAAHFVERLRIIESPLLGGVLLFFRRRPLRLVERPAAIADDALIAIGLSYYTAAINPIGEFTLFSSAVLTAGAGFLLLRNGWALVSWLSLAGTWGSFVFWQQFHTATRAGLPMEQTWGLALAMLVLYWLLFTAPVFLCRPEIFPPESRPVFLSLNNGVFFWLASGYLRLRYPQEYWIFAVAFGAVLLALAALARLRRAEEYVFDGAYLVQGLACVTYGIAVKFSGASLALTLAVESLLLLGGVRRRHGIIYRIAGVGVACWSFVLTMVTLDSAPAKIVPLGLSVAALLLLAAWWLKRGSGWLMPLQWSSRAALLAAQGMALITYVVIQKLDHTLQPAAFTVAAVIATASLYWVAMPEILLFGQLWLLLGVFLGIEMVMSVEQIVWWRILIPHAAALGLAHWWQRQRKMPDLRVLPFDGLCAAALVALGFFTLQAHFAGPGFSLFTTYFDFTGWAIAASFAGVATLAYGWGTQLWSLAAFGQMFSAAAVATWLAHLSADRLPWWAALLIISGVIAPAELATRLAEAKDRATAAKDEPPDPVTVIAPFYWAAAAILVAIWIFAYLPWRWQTFAFAGIGLALLAPRSPRPWQCVIGFGYFVLVYGGTILGHFGLLTGPGVLSLFGSLAPRWQELVAMTVIPAFLRRRRTSLHLSSVDLSAARTLASVGATVGTWVWLTAWVWEVEAPELLTIAWAVLAIIVFAAGLGLRERVYRVGGFAILALAILRVFLVDVWRLETVWRIISFLVLGAVLLALGFVYNRFAEQIRKWL